MIRIQTHTTVDDTLALEWEVLWHASSVSHPFNSPMWYRACLNTYHYPDVHIITVRDDKKLVAILPLVRTKRYGISSLTVPGAKYADMSSLLMETHDREILRSVIAYLAHTESFYLQEISAEEKEMLADHTKNIQIEASSVNPYLSLGTDPFRYVPERELYKLTRKAKRYRTELSFHTFWGDTGGLSLAFEIENASTKKKSGKASFTDPVSREFFVNLAVEFKEMLRIDVLFYNDKPFVYSIGFIHNKTYYALNTAFNYEYKHLIPGKMMLYYLLNTFNYEDVRLFYFSRGVNDLKLQFTPHSYVRYDSYFSKKLSDLIWWRCMNRAVHTLVSTEPLYKAYKKAQLALRAR